MRCYLISYDLKASSRNYDALYGAIKEYKTWARINDSFWAVVTNQSAVEVRANLMNFIDSNDSIFVVRSGTEAAWRNSQCKDTWLKKHL